MPNFLINVAVLVLKTVGMKAAAVAAIGSTGLAVIGGSILVGGTLVAKKVMGLFEVEMPKVDTDGSRQSTNKGTTEPHKIIYGETLVSGPVVFVATAGTDNKDLYYAVALAGHEVEDITDIHFDNVVIADADIAATTSTASTSGAVSGSGTFGPKGSPSTTICHVNKHLGTATQAADSLLRAAKPSKWTTAHQGKGIAYIVTKWVLNDDSAETWDKFTPNNIKAVVKGRKIYDPRLDSTQTDISGSGSHRLADSTTWEYSTNPALAVADYLMNADFGLGVNSSKIDWAAIKTAADGCDVSVSVPGGTESRFTCNGVLFGTDSHKTNINKLLSAMNGSIAYIDGYYVIKAGIHENPVVDLDEDDLSGSISIKTSLERGDRFNTVKGVFIDPASNYKSIEFPKVQLSTAYNRDNEEELHKEIALNMTNSSYMAQRIAHKLIQQSDLQKIVTYPTNMKGLRVAVGDRVRITNTELSWTLKEFQCVQWSFNEEGGVTLLLREENSAKYADPTVTPNNEYSTVTSDGVLEDAFRGVPTPSGLRVVSGEGKVFLDWVNPGNPQEFQTVHVLVSTDNNLANAVKAGETDGSQFVHDSAASAGDATEYAVGDTRYYWVRAVNFVGTSNEARSSAHGSQSVTVLATAVTWSNVANPTIGIQLDTDDSIEIVYNAETQTSGSAIATSGIEEDVTITQGGITMSNGGAIRGGQTAFDTGEGFFLGYVSGDNRYKFSIGDSSGEKLTFDDGDLSITGDINATSGTFTGTVNASAGAFTGDVTTNSKFTAGSSNDVAIVDGGDTLYRFYAGNASSENAAFRVDKDGHIDARDIKIYNEDGQVILDVEGFHGSGLGNISANSGIGVSEVAGKLDDNADEITFTTGTASEAYTFETKVQIDINQDAGSGESPTTSNLSFAGADQSAVTTIIGQVKLIVEYFVKTSGGSYSGTPDYTDEFTFVSGASASASQLGVNVFTLGSRGAGVVYSNLGASEAIADPSISGARLFVKSTKDITFSTAATHNVKVNARIATTSGTTLTTSTTPALDASVTTGTGVILGSDETQSSLEDFRRLYTIKPASGNTKTIIASTTDDTFSSTGGSSLLTSGGTISGNLTVTGDFTVQGTTTTLDTATLNVEDKNITVNYATGDSSGSADGAGITIQDAVDASTDATILWDQTNSEFDFSHSITVPGIVSTGTTENRFSALTIGADSDLYFYESATNEFTIRTGPSSGYKYFTFNDDGNFNVLNGGATLADELRISRNATDTRKIVLYDANLGNNYQFYGFGVEGSSFITSIYDTTDTWYWYAGTSTTARQLAMSLSGTGNATFAGKIEVGTFSNSQTNSGEAWIGRASDRDDGTLTIQLGGDVASGTKFEIVDRAWSKVIASISGEAPEGSFVINSSGQGSFAEQVEFPSAHTKRPVLTGGFLGLQTGDGDVDIWGISETYYPSAGTTTNAWGIRWASSPNQIQFVGGNVNRVTFDLDQGNTVIGGSITSGSITSSGKVTVSGSSNSYSTAPVVYFDSTSTANAGVRDWAIGPADDAYGNFHIFVGASTGADPVNAAGRVFTISNAGNVSLGGTISSGAITSSSLITGAGVLGDPYLQAKGADGAIAVYIDSKSSFDDANPAILNAPMIEWRESDGTNIAGIRGYVDASGNNNLALGTGFFDEEVTITSSGMSVAGQLTVGSDTSATHLIIDGASADYEFVTNSTSGYKTIFTMDDTASYIQSNTNLRPIILKTGSTDVAQFDYNAITLRQPIKATSSLDLFSTGSNNAFAHADARDSGDGARLHLYNKDEANGVYLPYYENWYDGSSYHSIGVEGDRWKLSDGLDVDGSNVEIGLFKSSNANARIKIQSTYTSTATNSAYIDLHTGNGGRGYLIKNGNGAGNSLPANSLYVWNAESAETSLISNATIGRRFAVTSGGTATKYQDASLGSTFVSTSTNSGAGQGFRVIKSYVAGDYVSLIEAPYSSGTNADIRLAAKFASSGSSLHFGTSDSYGYITKEPLVLDHAGNAYIKQIVAGQDGDTFTVPIDQDTGYSNHSFGGWGLLHREQYDSYVTSNAYYYKTGGVASWYSKYANRHVASLDFVDGEIIWRVTSTKATAANQAASISEKFKITSSGGITAKGLITADDADIFIDDSLAGGNDSAYTSANRLRFSNSHNDAARGPNKITMYASGTWQGGFGIHTSTVAYYSGEDHIFYKSGNTYSQLFKIDGGGGTSQLSTNLEIGNILYLGNTSAGSFVGVSGVDLEARADGAFRVYTYSGSWGERLAIGDNLATFKSSITSQASSTQDGGRVARWIYPGYESSYRLDIHQRVTSGVVRYSFGQVNNGTAYDDVLVLDRGNVAIGGGTVSPTNALDVNGVITSGQQTAVGIGGTPADGNTAELGPGYLNLARDDTASAKQIVFGKNGSIHTFIETTTAGLHIGGSSVVFNDDGANKDFRIESDGNANMFRLDGGSNTVNIGSAVGKQTAAHLNVRRNGGAIEFGHGNNTSGYYGTLGSYGNNGMPYIGFSTYSETSLNTFTTNGFAGNIIVSDQGTLQFNQVTNTNATGQTPVRRMTLDTSGRLTIHNNASPLSHAMLNIGWNSGETRAIDIDGGWTSGESKSISFTHGTSTANLVGQMRMTYDIANGVENNSSGSVFQIGRLYHGGDSSAYPVNIYSQSTTEATVHIQAKPTGTTAANRGFQVSTTGYGAIHALGNSSGTNGSADTIGMVTIAGNNGAIVQGGIYASQNSSSGTSIAIFTTDSYASGPKQTLSVLDNGVVNVDRGNLQIGGITVIDGSRNLTNIDTIDCDQGNLIIGDEAYQASAAYVGMKTAFQSGVNDYMIISGTSDGNTYVSAKDGSDVYVRGGGNASSNQLIVKDGTYIQATTSNFNVTGNITAYSSSDARLKHSVRNIENPLEKLHQLNGVHFDWSDEFIDRMSGGGQIDFRKDDVGVIAQEVKEVLDEVVAEREDGYLAVKYEKLTPLLIEGLKEADRKIEAQQKQIDQLIKLIGEMKNGDN